VFTIRRFHCIFLLDRVKLYLLRINDENINEDKKCEAVNSKQHKLSNGSIYLSRPSISIASSPSVLLSKITKKRYKQKIKEEWLADPIFYNFKRINVIEADKVICVPCQRIVDISLTGKHQLAFHVLSVKKQERVTKTSSYC
jgi:hypothetical protein